MTPSLKNNANFRWLMGGGILSMLGDQFTLIALPWLVLKLTGDPLSLGLVLALLGLPRAVFILIGGAVVDRYSPKRVFMLTKHASAVLVGALAALTLAGSATLTLVYALSLGIGLAQAFAYPSGSSMMPRAIPPELLQAANGALMGVRQVGMLAGPLLAALLLAIGDRAGAGAGQDGMFALGLAFAFDSLTFVASAWTLSKVVPLPGAPQAAAQNVFRSVAEGLLAVWRDVEMRTCFAYWGLVSVLIGGTMQVALPVLAEERLHDGSAFGMLMAAHGAGMLAGMAFSGLTARRNAGKPVRIGLLALGVDAMAGLLVIPLGLITAAWQGGLLLLSLGALVGLVQVAIFTWIQKRVQPQMMGRTMSIFMFILFGLAPLSSAATGWIMLHVTLPQMFAGGGVVLVLCATLALLFTPMRRIVTA